jgi:hypothetical protein
MEVKVHLTSNGHDALEHCSNSGVCRNVVVRQDDVGRATAPIDPC